MSGKKRDENRGIKTEYSLYLQINLNILNLKTWFNEIILYWYNCILSEPIVTQFYWNKWPVSVDIGVWTVLQFTTLIKISILAY